MVTQRNFGLKWSQCIRPLPPGLFVEFSGPICSGGAFVNSSGRKPRGLDPVLVLAPEESS